MKSKLKSLASWLKDSRQNSQKICRMKFKKRLRMICIKVLCRKMLIILMNRRGLGLMRWWCWEGLCFLLIMDLLIYWKLSKLLLFREQEINSISWVCFWLSWSLFFKWILNKVLTPISWLLFLNVWIVRYLISLILSLRKEI